jgi:predicted amidohydrolase YtcJ
MKVAFASLFGLALAATAPASPARAQDADTVLLNGKIVTLEAGQPLAEALAVRDGKILAVGRSDTIRALASSDTRVIDLAGRTVIPA